MPKKPNTVMKELAAADFGALLQDGKIVKMRAGKATIEHTKTLRGKKKVTTFHLNLSPQIVHEELPEEEAAPAPKKSGRKPAAKKAAPAEKKPGRKPAAKTANKRKPKEKAPAEKKPATKKKAAGGRKPATKKPTEPKPKAAPPAKPKAAPKTTPSSGAQMPWSGSNDLDDDDFEL